MKVSPAGNHYRNRPQSGMSLALVAVCAGFLMILLFIVFQFLTLNSSSREVRNAVDAAALNVSKKVGTLKVQIGSQFSDVADKGGLVGMSNINRVWGKAYLINANAEAIQREQLANMYTAQNADEAYRVAQNANDNLVNALTDKQSLDIFFNEMANMRNAKLMGNGSSLKTIDGPGWDVAMVDRGAPSNIQFDQKQIPNGASVAPSNAQHVSGYQPFKANNKNFTFAAFVPNEMPHLTTDGNFNANDSKTNPLNGNPIPNAFRANGINTGTKYALGASASSVANPRHEYRLSIPHAYIKVIVRNTALWTVNGQVVKTTTYKMEPQTQQGIVGYKLPNNRILNGYASLGNEYKKGDLLSSINALPADHTEAFNRMLQRIREIKHDYSMSELMNLLQKQPNEAGAYVIYPTFNTQDLTDPRIQCLSYDPSNPQLPIPWMNTAINFDGLAKTIVQEAEQKDDPNYCWVQIIGGNPDCEHYTLESGKVFWAPGTGYNACLGVLVCARVTAINFNPN